jgi:hypothetical protein
VRLLGASYDGAAGDGISDALGAIDESLGGGRIVGANLTSHFVLEGFELVKAWREIAPVKGGDGGTQAGDEGTFLQPG